MLDGNFKEGISDDNDDNVDNDDSVRTISLPDVDGEVFECINNLLFHRLTEQTYITYVKAHNLASCYFMNAIENKLFNIILNMISKENVDEILKLSKVETVILYCLSFK